jgi:hypothetical protein
MRFMSVFVVTQLLFIAGALSLAAALYQPVSE